MNTVVAPDDKIEQFEIRLDEIVRCAREAGIACCDISNALLRVLVRNAPTLADAAKLNMRANVIDAARPRR